MCLNRAQQLIPYYNASVQILCTELGILLCLNIGNCCLWAWRDNAVDLGADDRTISSVSDALSSRLPGPTVPGFQNCMVITIFSGVERVPWFCDVRCGEAQKMTDSSGVAHVTRARLYTGQPTCRNAKVSIGRPTQLTGC